MRIHKFSILSLAAVSLFALNACSAVGVATGAGATVGVAAVQEGGLSRAYDDAKIQAQINKLWLDYDFDTFSKLDLTISHGRVLVTGVVQDPEDRVEAIRLAWQPKGVKQVLNEVRVEDSRGFTSYARDTWISTRIRGAITFDSDVQSVNYSIDTVKGVVYLLGVAQSQAELNRVIEISRTVPDVDQVVSYVRILGEEVPEQQPPGYSNNTPTNTPGNPPAYQPQQNQAPQYNPNAPVAYTPPAYSPPQNVAPAAGGNAQGDTSVQVMPLDPPMPTANGTAQGRPTALRDEDRQDYNAGQQPVQPNRVIWNDTSQNNAQGR